MENEEEKRNFRINWRIQSKHTSKPRQYKSRSFGNPDTAVEKARDSHWERQRIRRSERASERAQDLLNETSLLLSNNYAETMRERELHLQRSRTSHPQLILNSCTATWAHKDKPFILIHSLQLAYIYRYNIIVSYTRNMRISLFVSRHVIYQRTCHIRYSRLGIALSMHYTRTRKNFYSYQNRLQYLTNNTLIYTRKAMIHYFLLSNQTKIFDRM